jgi:hypothetical protein
VIFADFLCGEHAAFLIECRRRGHYHAGVTGNAGPGPLPETWP